MLLRRNGPRSLRISAAKNRARFAHRLPTMLIAWVLVFSTVPQAILPQSAITPVPAQAQENTIAEEEIVYIDSQGFIHVWDPNVPAGKVENQWVSLEGGHQDIALGDVNNDGDQEIIAIWWNGISGKLIVYDPVLNSPSLTEDGVINGIPWKKLYEEAIPGRPIMVGTGELNAGVNGDEIAYGYLSGNFTVVNVLRGTRVQHDGTAWDIHIPVTFDFTWNSMFIGNADGIGTDEIILTDDGSETDTDKSKLHMYRVDTDSLITQTPIFRKTSTNNKWRGVAIGEMKKGGAPEVAAYRSVAGAGALTVFLLQYRPEREGDPALLFEEADGDAIEMLRRPHWAFMADVNGPVNGVQDYEAFFLREVRDETEQGKKRLLVENRGDDSIDKDKTSLTLDEASNWRRGEGGNIDGSADGREEVILMASNKIRIYRYIVSGDNHLQLSQEFNIATNEKSLQVGDLDTIGFSSGVLLDIEAPTDTLEILSGNRGLLTFQITGSSDGVPINVVLDESNPFITSIARGPNTTPSSYQIGIDASNLLPGTYSIPVRVTSTDPDVNNNPLVSNIEFDVVPAQVTVIPSSAGLTQFPCSGVAEDKVVELQITGSTGINYSAVVITQPEIQELERILSGSSQSGMVNAAGMVELSDELGNHTVMDALATPEISASGVITWASPDWIDAVSEKGTIDRSGTANIPSDTITLTIKGSQIPTGTIKTSAALMLITDERTGMSPDNLIFVPINYLCAASKLSLPLVYPADTFVTQ